ncbi:MAG TPA: hypothetical protein VFA79_01325 [Myxococcales bacterium]|nr:hypothetical protein [Myxococcales bacterium]
MKAAVAIAFSLALPVVAAQREEMQIRNQGAVRSRVWSAVAGLESAQISMRALTGLANDATAWDSQQAKALASEAKRDIETARAHARKLAAFGDEKAKQEVKKLESDLGAAATLVGKLQAPIAHGVSPKNDDTQADNTLLGGAAADRGLPPGKGGDVTRDLGGAERGGTPQVEQLRSNIKDAWDRLDDARKDLDQIARKYETTTKLPEP